MAIEMVSFQNHVKGNNFDILNIVNKDINILFAI